MKLKFCLLLLSFTSQGILASTLKSVKKAGVVKCGVTQGLPGFSSPDSKNQWSGIDVDVCKAVAAAVFSDASKVKYVPLSAKERFTALQSGEIDILSRVTTWTLERDVAMGINFTGVTYYDGQGFMVKKSLGLKSAKDLNGATVCVTMGTTSELNLADYFRSHKLKYKLVSIEKNSETIAAYDAGRCDVISTDKSGLYSAKLKLKKPDQHVVLPETISKEPLGPAVRHGDDQWMDIVRWVQFAMLEAEEFGVDSKNVAKLKKTSKSPGIKRLLGVNDHLGENLGLVRGWAYEVIKQVGNYKESFRRNLGSDSKLKIDRGLNKLWSHGGLQYPMPVR